MALFRLLAFGLLSLRALAQEDVEAVKEAVEEPSTTPNLNVRVSVSFPQSEIFGVKLVNGHTTEAQLSFDNSETLPITVAFIGGSLWTQPYGEEAPQSRIVRNLTMKSYNTEVPAKATKSLTYTFTQELHPQDLILNLAAVLTDSNGVYYTLQAYNQTVSIVEAPTSFFDPQIIFLYLILAGAFAGTSYFIYTTWITTFFPQQKRPKRTDGKGGDRRAKKVDAGAQIGGAATDGVATTTGSKVYDESWIPDHHKKSAEPKVARSGTPKGAKTKSKAA